MRWSDNIQNLGCQVVYYPGYFSLPTLADFSEPLDTQLLGPDMQKVMELAGRTCYESVGFGRSTTQYFKHIVEVGHLSVGEHGAITVRCEIPHSVYIFIPWLLMNRPGLWVRLDTSSIDGPEIELTANLRTILEWGKWFRSAASNKESTRYRLDKHLDSILYRGLSWAMRSHVPALEGYMDEILCANYSKQLAEETLDTSVMRLGMADFDFREVTPETDEQIWISLFLQGSRGFSHEMVRHGDFTAISQRSTRFVDETDSPWIEHPLLHEYLSDPNNQISMQGDLSDCQEDCQNVYQGIVDTLSAWLPRKYPNLNKTTARKQARGAARGYLGNALATNMVFSASVAEWREILKQRGNPAADWEMRELTCCVFQELLTTPYAERFSDFHLVPEENGMGMCVTS